MPTARPPITRSRAASAMCASRRTTWTRSRSTSTCSFAVWPTRAPSTWTRIVRRTTNRDANFAFVFEDVPRDRYEEEFGTEDSPAPATLDHTDGWNDKDHVRVAEYWRRNVNNATIHRLNDGTVVRDDEIPDELRDQITPMIVKSRDVAEPEIEWFKLAGDKIVDREEWLGKYIPIVPFIGEETVIDGVMDRKGHTRSADRRTAYLQLLGIGSGGAGRATDQEPVCGADRGYRGPRGAVGDRQRQELVGAGLSRVRRAGPADPAPRA